MLNKVGIVMGSDSDLPCMSDAAKMLEELGVEYEMTIVSAHRTPELLKEYAANAPGKNIRVIVAGAGGAAHLPGMLAAYSTLPVIGVPIKTAALNGIDSLYSIVQMPKGVPVATVAINGGANAGILAAQIIGAFDDEVSRAVSQYKTSLAQMVSQKAMKLEMTGYQEYNSAEG